MFKQWYIKQWTKTNILFLQSPTDYWYSSPGLYILVGKRRYQQKMEEIKYFNKYICHLIKKISLVWLISPRTTKLFQNLQVLANSSLWKSISVWMYRNQFQTAKFSQENFPHFLPSSQFWLFILKTRATSYFLIPQFSLFKNLPPV